MTRRPDTPLRVWRELAWHDTADVTRAIEALEHVATSPTLGMLALELRTGGSRAVWLVGAEAAHAGDVSDLLGAHLPLHPHPDTATTSVERRVMHDVGRLAVRGQTHLAVEPERVMLAAHSLHHVLHSAGREVEVALQLLLGRRLTPPMSASTPHGWMALLTGTPTRTQSALPASERRRQGFHGCAATFRLGLSGGTPRQRLEVGRQVLAALRLLESPGLHMDIHPDTVGHLHQAARPWRWPLRVSSPELPVLTGWPIGETSPLLGSTHPRRLAPRTPLICRERVVGVVDAPGVNTPVGLPIRDALFHTHLLGPTGVGKSTVMLNLIQADMAAGGGLLLLDPKGDLATDVLARIPTTRLEDVVVIDPTNPTPVGFNPLQGPTREAPVRADALLAAFSHIFSRTWGIRSADIFHACFLTLAHIPEATMLWLSPLLTDPAFRRHVLARVNDPIGVGGFWAQWDAKSTAQQSEEIAPILNKLRQLILRPGLRAVVGQTHPRFTLTDLFTHRRIVIVSLNKGIIGADAARLLGSLLIASLWQEILRRARLQPEARSTVCVYIDEAHDFLAGIPGDLSDALAQSRSLGVAFTLAHQYLSQLSPAMRASLETNTRNTVAFTLAASDATTLSAPTPDLTALDFQSLPAYHAYATLLQAGHSTGWFSLTTNPPPPALRDASQAYAASHTRYGIPATDTDRAILDLTRLDHASGDRGTWNEAALKGGSDEGPIGRRRR